MMTVESVAVTVGEMPSESVTVFTSGEGAIDATSTVSVRGGKAEPGTNPSERVQTPLVPVTEQVQPVPVMALMAMPKGGVSLTVTTVPASEGNFPAFTAVIV
jgi:hypothetical protein